MASPQKQDTDLRRMVESLTSTVASLVQRLPPLPAEEVAIETESVAEERNDEDFPTGDHPQSTQLQPPTLPIPEHEDTVSPNDWLTGLSGVGPRETPPVLMEFIRNHWGPEGRQERCRKALADFPRRKLAMFAVPELNPEMRALAREAARRRGSTEGDLETGGVHHRDQALRTPRQR
ncbi:uncharacterized protein LOC135392869 [Ornithodoros turicata]|uniref:uncharacterized protein LOC135392869 n=1 Tax=Ornithodoros turicata TaxID=34597 RepID=UPI0031391580